MVIHMDKAINLLTKAIIISLYVYTWNFVEKYGDSINKTYIYVYISFVALSLLSDKYFYKGQKSGDNKSRDMTTHFISLTWFTSLIMPVLEHAYIVRHNLFFTILGICLVLLGIAIRALGIKTLGKYFSRDVETWENQKVVKTGIYKHIRHPAYAGNILQVVGFLLILNSFYSLVLSLVTIIGFIWRIRVEEEFLKRAIPEYEKYMKETKRIIPKIW